MENSLEFAEKLILFQGISLIQDGLQFFSWIEMPDEVSQDMLTILTDRFSFFRTCVLEEREIDHLVLNRVYENYSNVAKTEDKFRQEIQDKLSEVRSLMINRRSGLHK